MSRKAKTTRTKAKLGRPRKPTLQLRSERVDTFFSILEKQKLTRDAKACGLSPAAYIRKLVAGHRPVAHADRSSDPRLLLELNAIGNNLQQLLGTLSKSDPARSSWLELKLQLEETLQHAALEEISVPDRLFMKLNAVGLQLNRAMADRHADSERKHDWKAIFEQLQEVLTEVAINVH